MIHTLNDTVALNNKVLIPGMGAGVFQIPDEQTAEVVKEAIIQGYRLIDTAQIYGNEEGTGQGIQDGLKAAGLKREDLFFTSKVWNNHLTYDETLAAFEDSLKKLGLDYLDLYLIHWPGNRAFEASWKALETLYREGKIRAIGVSNFEIHHLETLLSFAEVIPAVNQVELHPRLNQEELMAFTDQHQIKLQAWSPLMQGKILSEPVLTKIAEAHQKSVAQIVFRWAIQQDILLLTKTVHSDRMRSNAAIFDFELSDCEMSVIRQLNQNLRVGPDPDTFDF